jgi:hypothetical protein
MLLPEQPIGPCRSDEQTAALLLRCEERRSFAMMLFMMNPIICRDRLGTRTGKTQSNLALFAGCAAAAAVATAHGHGKSS